MNRRVLVVANDRVGTTMAGPGIRSLRFASELARDHDVTLVVPFPTDIEPNGFAIVQDDPWDAHRMNDRIAAHDVVVAQKLPVSTLRALSGSEKVAIFDLYDPVPIETLAWAARHPRSRRTAVTQGLNAVTLELTLSCGDAFICASEKQRDLWLGSLLAYGRVGQEAYEADPSLRSLVDVVPFGIEPDRPVSTAPVLKGVIPGIAETDKVLLWGGGIWDWFDPLTVIRAVEHLRAERDDIRVFFLGLSHPNPGVPRMQMELRAIDLAEELGMRDRTVFFNDNERWVPYDRRGAFYLEADLGVSAHFDDLETRFAFRTRLLDYFWGGLPTVTTAGDALADVIKLNRLGRVVAAGDVAGWATAIRELLDADDERNLIEQRLEIVRTEFLWPRVVEPLRRLVDSTTAGRTRIPATATANYVRRRLENAVLQRGTGNAAAAGARWALRLARPPEERARPPLP